MPERIRKAFELQDLSGMDLDELERRGGSRELSGGGVRASPNRPKKRKKKKKRRPVNPQARMYENIDVDEETKEDGISGDQA